MRHIPPGLSARIRSSAGSFSRRSNLTLEEIEAVELTGSWIWGPLAEGKRVPDAGETLLVRKVIELPGKLESGGAVLTCDNEFTLYINNKQIASGTDWTRPQTVALKNLLKPGKNQVIVKIKNGGNPNQPNAAGFYFEARLKLQDGSTQNIVSDASWEANTNVVAAKENRLQPPKVGWKPVVVVPALSVWTDTLRERARPLIAAFTNKSADLTSARASLLKNTPLMKSLGRPTRDQIVSMRPSSLTTLEAIDLANEPTLAATINTGAENWLASDWDTTDALVDSLFQATLTRKPTDSERGLFVEFLGEKPTPAAMSDAMWSLCMLPEFLLIR